MRVKKARMDYAKIGPNEWKFFTSNSYITNDGCLAMGKGAALTVKNSYPDIDRDFGRVLKDKHLKDYHVSWLRPPGIGAFQVKRNFKDRASISLIRDSATVLNEFAKLHPNDVIQVNFPGIGYGGLDFDDVYSVLKQQCPQDNITFWML